MQLCDLQRRVKQAQCVLSDGLKTHVIADNRILAVHAY